MKERTDRDLSHNIKRKPKIERGESRTIASMNSAMVKHHGQIIIAKLCFHFSP